MKSKQSKNNFKRKNNSGFKSDFSKRRGSTNKNRPNRRRKGQAVIDPNNLIKKAVPATETASVDRRKFSELPLEKQLKDRIERKGYVHMTEIQDKTIEALIEGDDVMGIASTGSGKTAAFLIPIINQQLTFDGSFQALILVPTRELALQVEEEFKSLTKGLGMFCTSLIGGTNIQKDMQRLRRTNHLIIGTPGRVIDLIKRRALNLRPFSTLILDEFDRMLDMGFADDVMHIISNMQNREQTILFSATENGKQKALIDQLLHEPKNIRVSSGNTSAEHIDQDIVRIQNGENKFDVLLDMIRKEDFDKVLVFAETKRWVAKLTEKLKKAGISADEIHGDKSQGYRKKALNRFRSGNVQVLVATDVAARGIDVDDITHVINYELPQSMESYIHRIGRTGRAGKAGKAYTLVD